jgi:chemotaxis signal transduction protein
VSDLVACLHARVASRDILLPLRDLREVLPAIPVALLPGRPRGIKGVVVHEGEFLPVLAWEEMPGCRVAKGQPEALAVLRPRLGIFLDQMFGTVDVDPGSWIEPPPEDPWRAWLGAMVHGVTGDLPLLDADRLVALLHAFRSEH